MEPTQWWGHGFGFMWFIPLFFFVMFIFFMRGMCGRDSPGSGSHGSDGSHRESARDILDKRFAKGEIDKLEYEEMKKTLEKNSS